jgi:hypothetical protein
MTFQKDAIIVQYDVSDVIVEIKEGSTPNLLVAKNVESERLYSVVGT